MIKVLVQSSVLFAATLSVTGGSREILKLGKEKVLKVYTSQDIIDEVREHIEGKYPEFTGALERILDSYNLRILRSFSDRALAQFKDGYVSDPDDIHVIAAAKKVKVDYLITLDKKHFLNNAQLPQKVGISIVSPGVFLQEILC